MRRTLSRLIRMMLCAFGVVVLGGAAFYVVTAPDPLPDAQWADLGTPDVQNGERIFWAGGCVSCHAAVGAEDEAQQKILSGGLALQSPFGTFHAPNISPDPQAGIGNWTLAQFGNAIKRGVSEDGEHLYPSFPYGSYARLTPKDINDLFAYLKTLPASTQTNKPHQLGFPYNIRMAVGGWKMLYLNEEPRVALVNASDQVRRGQYLAEGPGHCGECHTPRDSLGGFKPGQWLTGAPNPTGEGRVPDITPGSPEIGSWSEADLVNYFETGFTPDFDTSGGQMAEVQRNLAHLPRSDLEAIAAYLKALPKKN